MPPDPALTRTTMSQEMFDGRVVHTKPLNDLYAEINARYGSNFQLPAQ